MKSSTAVVEKIKKDKEAIKGQFALLESEKAVPTKSLDEAKASRDKVVVLVVSLQSK